MRRSPLTIFSVCNGTGPGHAICSPPHPVGFSGALPVIHHLSEVPPVVCTLFIFCSVFWRRCLPWHSIEAKRMTKLFIQPLTNTHWQGKHFLGKIKQNTVSTPVNKQGPKTGPQNGDSKGAWKLGPALPHQVTWVPRLTPRCSVGREISTGALDFLGPMHPIANANNIKLS